MDQKKVLTQKEVLKEIRDMGLTASVFRGEYRINIKGGKSDTAYFTNDKDDALNTARLHFRKLTADSTQERQDLLGLLKCYKVELMGKDKVDELDGEICKVCSEIEQWYEITGDEQAYREANPE